MTRTRLAALALLLVCFGLLMHGIPRLSLTFDEPSHLAAGYAALARGSDGLWTMEHRGHPLLIDAWEALPLYAGNPHVPLEQLPGWREGYKLYVSSFIREIGSLEAIEIAGRVPAALLTLILAAVTFRWGQDLTSGRAGWIGLAVLVLDPNILAHGRLATNDIGVTALGTLGLLLLWRWSRKPAWRWGLLAGLIFGLTCLAKSSGILWLAAAGLQTVYSILEDKQHRSARLWQGLGVGAIALLTIWAAYGFSISPLDGGRVQVPAPAHWNALFFQTNSADNRLAYALGKLKMGGWWWYFPLVYALKTPIPLLLTAPIGAVLQLRRRPARRPLRLPIAFALLYAAVAIAEGPNLGYRHLLPLQPVAYLLVTLGCDKLLHRGLEGRAKARLVTVARLGAGILFGWYIFGSLRSTPNELAYFNEFAGPAERKHELLISSNLDWGQMMKQAAKFLRMHTDDTTYVAYAHPAPYPLPADRFLPPYPEADPITAPFHPLPGLYLIGATSLHIPSSCCGLGLDSYAYFRHIAPTDSIGGAILVYEVTAETTPSWLVQCGTLRPPLDETTIQQGFGDAGQMRQITLDCSRSWAYPAGSGVYAFSTDDNSIDDPFMQLHLASARLSYEQPAGFIPEPFVLYEAVADPAPDLLPDARTADATTAPEALGADCASSYRYAQSMEYLGASSIHGSASTSDVEVMTWWRIIAPAPSEPLSIMAHLITSTGNVLGIADGLGVAPGSLQPGDVLVQRHTFTLSDRIGDQDIWLRTGLYRLNDLTRLTLEGKAQCDAVFVRLEDR